MFSRRNFFGLMGVFTLGKITNLQAQETHEWRTLEELKLKGPVCFATLVALDGRHKKIKIKQPLIVEVDGEEILIPICPIKGNAPQEWKQNLNVMVNDFAESCHLDLK